jgi:hypothetical protein
MMRRLQVQPEWLLTLPWLLSHFGGASADITTVSLAYSYPHDCVNKCLTTSAFVVPAIWMGEAQGCGLPMVNDCYCRTDSHAASVATSFVSDCVSQSCAAGDRSDDLSAMKSIYASYCMGAGFTQPGMTDWYNPATATTSQTSSSSASPGSNAGNTVVGSTSTTTEVTLVTQTTTGQPSSNAGTTSPGVLLGKLYLLLGPAFLAMGLLQVGLLPYASFHRHCTTSR